MKIVRALLKFVAFTFVTLCIVIVQSVILVFHRGRYAYVVPKIWQKLVCFIFQIRVRVEGHICTQGQTFFVSNHISYLDIPALGSVVKGSFIAKRDVATWPVFGRLSVLQQTLFISRDRKDAAQGKRMLSAALAQKKNLIVFPEGTSTEGVSVYPFKSSLFSIALQEEAQGLFIQPITLKIDRINGRTPETQAVRDIYAWHVNMDMGLGPHLWRFAQSRGAQIRLVFHPPVTTKDYSDRKTLAKHCQNAVSMGLGS